MIHHVHTRIRPHRFYCLGRQIKKEDEKGRQIKKQDEKVFSTATMHFNLSSMHLHDTICCSVSHRVLFCPCLQGQIPA
jgi:hypothetical protein